MFSKLLTATTVALAASMVSAQTHSDCDPTKKTGCPNDPAVGATVYDIDFRKGANSFFKAADGTTIKYDSSLGATFTINKETDAPTISSSEYIFFGQVDVTVRASAGVGVVTSFVLQSDDLDEIDWEWLGGDATQVQTNYFSKGCTDTYDRGGFSSVADPINNFITYTVVWTPTQLQWIINGAVVRTLTNNGVASCEGFPQTPMQIKLGTWVAGRKNAPEGTIQWAGGLTDFTKAPFNGYYQSIKIQDFQGGSGPSTSKATEYIYGDQSGTWKSIKVSSDGKTSSGSSSSSASSSIAASSSHASSASSTHAASTTAKPTSSSAADSSSAATTLTTVSANGHASNGTFSTSTTAGSTATSTGSVANPSHTGAAGKIVGNVAAAGAAALLGFLAL